MIASDGTLIYSATDLVAYLACDHLGPSSSGRPMAGLGKPTVRDDPSST